MRSVEELEVKIQILENENRLLKERLTEAGISYADIVEDHIGDTASNYDPDQGARILSPSWGNECRSTLLRRVSGDYLHSVSTI